MSETTGAFVPTDRSVIKRLPNRAAYDRETLYAILDEGLVCHIGFAVDGSQYVIPTGYARDGDVLYVHGSAGSRMMRTLEQGVQVCVTVTLLDGLVLARSAFHHSMNYRSVVVFGVASAVRDNEEKLKALRAFSEHIIPGRWDHVREPDQNELKATLVLKLPLTEASAKVRTGPPIDDEPDYALPVWAGVLPLHLQAGVPVPDPRLPEGIDPPDYVLHYTRRRV
jgi:nitroimidazol reductase NimA-like FMN-containing flavoprotein (pyridoxamine 5'-phosphate oxidase superfamily)